MRAKRNLLLAFLALASSTMVQASRTLPRSQWPVQENQDDLPVLDRHVIKTCLDSYEEEENEIIISEPKSASSYLGDNTQENE